MKEFAWKWRRRIRKEKIDWYPIILNIIYLEIIHYISDPKFWNLLDIMVREDNYRNKNRRHRNKSRDKKSEKKT